MYYVVFTYFPHEVMFMFLIQPGFSQIFLLRLIGYLMNKWSNIDLLFLGLMQCSLYLARGAVLSITFRNYLHIYIYIYIYIPTQQCCFFMFDISVSHTQPGSGSKHGPLQLCIGVSLSFHQIYLRFGSKSFLWICLVPSSMGFRF